MGILEVIVAFLMLATILVGLVIALGVGLALWGALEERKRKKTQKEIDKMFKSRNKTF